LVSAQAVAPLRAQPVRSNRRSMLFEWGVTVAATLLLIALVVRNPHAYADWELLVWLVVIGVVELFPIPTWGGAEFSVTDPLVLALAIVYPPEVALGVVLLGASDPREFRRTITLRRALWNRSQCALSIYLAGAVFHAVASPTSSWVAITLAALLMAAVYNGVNASAVALSISLRDGIAFARALRGLLLDAPFAAAASYLSFAVIGMFIARLYLLAPGGHWVLASFAIPLVIVARSTYLHIRSARRALDVSQQRTALIRTVSDRVAKERSDERKYLAGLLHDDAIPYAEGINLTANIALASLDSGHPDAAREALGEIREASVRSAAELRSLVGDLRRSPLDGRSLPEALHELCSAWTTGPPVRVAADGAVEVPDAAGLLLYLIAREAVGNAIKHSAANEVQVRLWTHDGRVELSISDDGNGFDQGAIPPGHFGLTLIRERAEALSGELDIRSGFGQGTTVSVRAPVAGW
jgi:signal transduction histidine kinase